jgi:hypothetical protein
MSGSQHTADAGVAQSDNLTVVYDLVGHTYDRERAGADLHQRALRVGLQTFGIGAAHVYLAAVNSAHKISRTKMVKMSVGVYDYFDVSGVKSQRVYGFYQQMLGVLIARVYKYQSVPRVNEVGADLFVANVVEIAEYPERLYNVFFGMVIKIHAPLLMPAKGFFAGHKSSFCHSCLSECFMYADYTLTGGRLQQHLDYA